MGLIFIFIHRSKNKIWQDSWILGLDKLKYGSKIEEPGKFYSIIVIQKKIVGNIIFFLLNIFLY